MDLLQVPRDVSSIIWMNLNLQDVARLRQTCSTLLSEISGDKQLWAHVFDRNVKSRSLCVPANLRSIEEAEASDIESWVKHAVLLNCAFHKADRKLRVNKIEIRADFRITLVKIILGRWCLVAASNDDESELSLWEIIQDCGMQCRMRRFLDAPVIDGQIDDTSGEVRCAMTLGATQPYIIVLSFYNFVIGIDAQELSRISRAGHVLFFRGDIVGFAVRDGDDTYPYVANWRTGKVHCLCFPSRNPSGIFCPLPIGTCRAMNIQNEFIYVLHRTAIEVFIVPYDPEGHFNGDSPRHFASLPLQEPAFTGQFLDISPTGHCEIEEPKPVYLFYQNKHSAPIGVIVSVHKSRKPQQEVSIKEAYANKPDDVGWTRCMHIFRTGLSGRVVFSATSTSRRCRWQPDLYFASIRISSGVNSVFPPEISACYNSFSREGLPLLHLMSCVDFDDGNGLLLIATSSGDVRVASILPETIVTPKSLRSSLSNNESKEFTSRLISPVPVSQNLPLYYSLRKSYTFGDVISRETKEQATLEWQDPRIGARTFSDWSNDWLEFGDIWNWIFPLSRWGLLDADFMDRATSTALRNRLRTLGEIIPILYNTRNHCRVFFRVGQRIFYSRVRREEEDDDDGDDDSEDDMTYDDYGILGVLPLTYNEFLTDPTSILPFVSDWRTQRNLEEWRGPYQEYAQMGIARSVYAVRRYWGNVLGKTIDDDTMAKWSNDEWDKNYLPAIGRSDALD